MQKILPLEPGVVYHICNRGNNREGIFKEERNYTFFLQRYAKYVSPVAETYAYCLLKNHFHLLIRVKETPENSSTTVSRQLSHLFNSYAKAINKAYPRTGSLFQRPFRRKRVDSDAYFGRMIYYIHTNPQKHGFVRDFRDYPHSSYHAMLPTLPTKLEREYVLDWFGGVEGYEAFHRNAIDGTDFPLEIGD